MAIKDSYQAELIHDEEYLIRAAEAAIFAYGSAISFDKLAEAIGAEEKQIPQLLHRSLQLPIVYLPAVGNHCGFLFIACLHNQACIRL